MGSNYAPNPGPPIDITARPAWQRTGHKAFPFAAQQSGQWWVLRFNFGFPEHDMYTLFVDGRAVADITADPDNPMPLLASIGALPTSSDPGTPALDTDLATAAIGTVAGFADYGSEHGDPCIFCSSAANG
ncbi:hypothetical protein B5P44_00970 [Mycobacterium sp. CBMA 213]|uniref:Uncharacterized protein n=1 Tax=Mycolicibacterium sp. CBMA 213 TaxID=1968788 RepID=A0A343VRI4_9MYCO|nr:MULTISPECIES: hypothetical protein [unclassified Mycolicibacterium]AVN58508.1 hypothetical protein B5P44_p00213 [Mycolicibacterium sp. CBMA 213]MUL61154.1 hypothetical protein [Mycolicibacterium sp. CBMA 335]MUM03392.1 hypothetical protein [Mycolicibacterium sp. CBMA 213]